MSRASSQRPNGESLNPLKDTDDAEAVPSAVSAMNSAASAIPILLDAPAVNGDGDVFAEWFHGEFSPLVPGGEQIPKPE